MYRPANNTRMPFILFTVVKNISPSYSMYVDVCRPQQLTFLKVLILKCRLALDPFNTVNLHALVSHVQRLNFLLTF